MKSRSIIRFIFILLGLVSLYAAGLGIRRTVLEAQLAEIGEDMPFTLESALHYRRVKMMYDRGTLPVIDEAIQYPDGVRIREIDGVTSEPTQAFLARFFRGDIPFPSRIRWIEAGWYCLGIPLLALAIRIWTGSWVGGLAGGTLYALSIASVLRSTGQEISRENFAFPFLMAAFVFAACRLRVPSDHVLDRARGHDGACPSRDVPPVLFSLLFALFMAGALIAWDMVQYVIGFMALAMSLHVIRRGPDADRRLISLFSWLTLAVFLVGHLNTYHRFHGLPWSPLMLWLATTTLTAHLTRLKSLTTHPPSTINHQPFLHRIVLIYLPVLLLLLIPDLTGSYGASYNHFAELLWAKIRFLNQKPEDPGLLNYYQRVMWVPALHSATWGLTKWLFPLALWIVLVAGAVAWPFSRKQPDPLIRFWLVFLGVSVVSYVFFVRFHIFVALSTAVLVGWLTARISLAGPVWRVAAVVLAGLVISVEARHTLDERIRMGRPNVYYDAMEELADWLREEIAPRPVLANMGISAYLAAYAKCPVAIHPKFEDPGIRKRLEHYGNLMFGADEQQLRDWMDELGINILVYAKGEFATTQPEYQMRYFANQMNPPDHVPARRFERDDETMRYFTRLWGNYKYVVYEALDGMSERRAAVLASSARNELLKGNLAGAEQFAIEALAIDRHQTDALEVMRHVGSLIEQGVETR